MVFKFMLYTICVSIQFLSSVDGISIPSATRKPSIALTQPDQRWSEGSINAKLHYPATLECNGPTIHDDTSTGTHFQFGANGSKDKIYKFDVLQSTDVNISTCVNEIDTTLRLYPASAFNNIDNLEEAGFGFKINDNNFLNENNCAVGSSMIIVKNLHRGTWYIVVEGFDNEDGTSDHHGKFDLRIDCSTSVSTFAPKLQSEMTQKSSETSTFSTINGSIDHEFCPFLECDHPDLAIVCPVKCKDMNPHTVSSFDSIDHESITSSSATPPVTSFTSSSPGVDHELCPFLICENKDVTVVCPLKCKNVDISTGHVLSTGSLEASGLPKSATRSSELSSASLLNIIRATKDSSIKKTISNSTTKTGAGSITLDHTTEEYSTVQIKVVQLSKVGNKDKLLILGVIAVGIVSVVGITLVVLLKRIFRKGSENQQISVLPYSNRRRSSEYTRVPGFEQNRCKSNPIYEEYESLNNLE